MGERRRETPDEPIYGPPSLDTHHPLDADPENNFPGGFARIQQKIFDAFRGPGRWIRANIVEPNRGEKYYWYHRRYPRALPVDECYSDDIACVHEANVEFRRNFQVDREALNLLLYRSEACAVAYLADEGPNKISDKCLAIREIYEENLTNFHIKYGDLPTSFTVRDAYMKQKHRMIMERRQELQRKEREQQRQEAQPG